MTHSQMGSAIFEWPHIKNIRNKNVDQESNAHIVDDGAKLNKLSVTSNIKYSISNLMKSKRQINQHFKFMINI